MHLGQASSRGQPISQRQVAGLLKGYGIRSRSVRDGDDTAKGYRLDQFTEAFARYLPPAGRETPPRSVTPSQPNDTKGLAGIFSVTTDRAVTDKDRPNPLNANTCAGVTDETPFGGGGGIEQCGGDPDGQERLRVMNGESVLLHRQCERFYLAARDEDLPR